MKTNFQCRSTLLAAALMMTSYTAKQTMAAEPLDCHTLGRSTAQHWIDRTPMPLIDTTLTMEQAECARAEFLKALRPLLGEAVGYKVAAITPPAQRDLGVRDPLSSTYLAGMFRTVAEQDVVISAKYGVRPIVEAKLMVIVKDAGINGAKTVDEVASHIEYVLPSIELGDSLVQPDQKLTGPILTVYNVGTRAMLNGHSIRFNSPEALTHALRNMTVTTRDGSGKTIEVERGTSIMGDPLKAILWIVQDQNSRGVQLKTGDKLGLGAMSRVRPTNGTVMDTIWEGLEPDPVNLQVRFN
jgi:2-keto-4-pentenoate hydratase